MYYSGNQLGPNLESIILLYHLWCHPVGDPHEDMGWFIKHQSARSSPHFIILHHTHGFKHADRLDDETMALHGIFRRTATAGCSSPANEQHRHTLWWPNRCGLPCTKCPLWISLADYRISSSCGTTLSSCFFNLNSKMKPCYPPNENGDLRDSAEKRADTNLDMSGFWFQIRWSWTVIYLKPPHLEHFPVQ